MRINNEDRELASVSIVAVNGMPRGCVWACDTEEGWAEYVLSDYFINEEGREIYEDLFPGTFLGEVEIGQGDSKKIWKRYRFHGKVEIVYTLDPEDGFRMPPEILAMYDKSRIVDPSSSARPSVAVLSPAPPSPTPPESSS